MTISARNLHGLLNAVQQSKSNILQTRWAQVLGADVGSIEFGQKFTSVLTLWRETVMTLEAMPDGSTKTMGLNYARSWLNAILQTGHNWSSQGVPDLMTTSQMHMLEMVAESLSGLSETPAPEPATLIALADECLEWIDLVEGSVEIPKGLRVSLVECLNQVLVLIDNAEIFGIAPIVEAADLAAGRLTRVAAGRAQATGDASWLKKSFHYLGLVGKVAGAVHTGNLAIADGKEIFEEIQKAIDAASGSNQT